MAHTVNFLTRNTAHFQRPYTAALFNLCLVISIEYIYIYIYIYITTYVELFMTRMNVKSDQEQYKRRLWPLPLFFAVMIFLCHYDHYRRIGMKISGGSTTRTLVFPKWYHILITNSSPNTYVHFLITTMMQLTYR